MLVNHATPLTINGEIQLLTPGNGSHEVRATTGPLAPIRLPMRSLVDVSVDVAECSPTNKVQLKGHTSPLSPFHVPLGNVPGGVLEVTSPGVHTFRLVQPNPNNPTVYEWRKL